ncbi:protein-export protein SecB [Alphaproteobacteria bacterium]|nr:protein-export protein SecB [Alphaproteobacteria bacterium]
MAETEKENKAQYPFYIQEQYIKDLSFENPNFLLKYSDQTDQPQVNVNVETGVSKISDNSYEVPLKCSVTATVNENSLFVLDLVYAGLTFVAQELNQDVLETILLVHAPYLLFPFARELVANLTRYGGYPPLLIEPVNFAALFVEKKSAEAQKEVTQKDREVAQPG